MTGVAAARWNTESWLMIQLDLSGAIYFPRVWQTVNTIIILGSLFLNTFRVKNNHFRPHYGVTLPTRPRAIEMAKISSSHWQDIDGPRKRPTHSQLTKFYRHRSWQIKCRGSWIQSQSSVLWFLQLSLSPWTLHIYWIRISFKRRLPSVSPRWSQSATIGPFLWWRLEATKYTHCLVMWLCKHQ